MLDVTKDTRLGNVYDVTAAVATESTRHATEGIGLVIDKEGTLTTFTTQNPRYSDYVVSKGFVCYLTAGSDPARIAARLREAHMRVLRG